MRVLYLTNIHNPYRDEFFEQLGRECELTVLFEKTFDSNRDASWFEGVTSSSYHRIYLPGNEGKLRSKTMLKTIGEGWSLVIVGCYNTPYQIDAVLYMRRRGIPYAINSDGMVFDSGSRLKRLVRDYVLSGADAYLVAGEKCVASMKRAVGNNVTVHPYHFSSLKRREIERRSTIRMERDRTLILSIGRFEDNKGLDVLIEAAIHFPEMRFKVVGTGNKKPELDALIAKRGLTNVTTIAFLKPDELAKEYAHAGLFVLPSRQECWGLVINEAAAAGCPIVSTWGSGAAVEFIADYYPEMLAIPGDVNSLVECLQRCISAPKEWSAKYGAFLRAKASAFTIEAMVDSHIKALEAFVNKNHAYI